MKKDTRRYFILNSIKALKLKGIFPCVTNIAKDCNLPYSTVYWDVKSMLTDRQLQESETKLINYNWIQSYEPYTNGGFGIPKNEREYKKKWRGFQINYKAFENLCYKQIY